MLRLHTAGIFERAAWRTQNDTRDCRLIALVSCKPQRTPDFARTLAKLSRSQPDFAAALAAEPTLAAASARQPDFVAIFARQPALTTALNAEPEFAAALAAEPDFTAALVAEPDFAAALLAEPDFAAVFARQPALATALSRQPEPFVIGADDANRCIKRLYTSSGRIVDTYRGMGETRVHNVLLPDLYDESDLCAIESAYVSRLVGVFIRNETLFRLVRLKYNKESEKNETWIQIWSAEFYRMDSEQLDAEAPRTSLCRAECHVLCAVAHSHRLAAFEYTSSREPLRLAGDQRFNEEIEHVDAFNSATGSLVAIAFADDSVRLYRNGSQQAKEIRFALQETCRVLCENVRKLLFAGERLLVAARSDDEEADSIWSCRLVGERLYGEARVLLDLQTAAVESWCFDHKFNQIYCVDSVTNQTHKLEYGYYISISIHSLCG